MVFISACLAGKACRYNGKAKPNLNILKMMEEGGEYRLFCPECLAGMPIPRQPSEILSGTGADVLDGRARVVGADGSDRTEEFLAGAQKALALAKKCGVKEAYLKAKSPSCGVGEVYDGSFSGKLISGNGVTAELFCRNGIKTIKMD